MSISCVTTYHRVLRKVIVAVHKVLTLSICYSYKPIQLKMDARQSISELAKEKSRQFNIYRLIGLVIKNIINVNTTFIKSIRHGYDF